MSFTRWALLKLTIVALPLASFTLGHRGRAYPQLVANENLRQIPPSQVGHCTRPIVCAPWSVSRRAPSLRYMGHCDHTIFDGGGCGKWVRPERRHRTHQG